MTDQKKSFVAFVRQVVHRESFGFSQEIRFCNGLWRDSWFGLGYMAGSVLYNGTPMNRRVSFLPFSLFSLGRGK